MCAKRPRIYQSINTPFFLQERGIITGQILAAKHWLKRHNFPPPGPN